MQPLIQNEGDLDRLCNSPRRRQLVSHDLHDHLTLLARGRASPEDIRVGCRNHFNPRFRLRFTAAIRSPLRSVAVRAVRRSVPPILSL